jgi:hypothetical protein
MQHIQRQVAHNAHLLRDCCSFRSYFVSVARQEMDIPIYEGIIPKEKNNGLWKFKDCRWRQGKHKLASNTFALPNGSASRGLFGNLVLDVCDERPLLNKYVYGVTSKHMPCRIHEIKRQYS